VKERVTGHRTSAACRITRFENEAAVGGEGTSIGITSSEIIKRLWLSKIVGGLNPGGAQVLLVVDYITGKKRIAQKLAAVKMKAPLKTGGNGSVLQGGGAGVGPLVCRTKKVRSKKKR